ncbi:MAG: TRAP transporter fused permease subunit [Alphaproteobacteria bacterium]|nr:TRAP transporter fused permease subunit [Alphaproteobacteria bacterium]
MSAVIERLKRFSFRDFVALVAFAMSTYHLVVGYLGEPVAEVHRPIHVLLALLILFWNSERSTDPSKRRLQFTSDIILSLILIAACGYLFVNATYVSERMIYVTPLTMWEMIWGVALILLILEAARRSVGIVLVIVGGVFLIYTTLGPHLAPPFWHNGYSVEQTIEHMYLTTYGIWTTPVAVTASFVFLFVLFGSLLLSSGAGDFFTDLAKALTGRQIGGPAKTAVVSSAFMGTLSGSSAANVVTTGSFTIPAMKQAGYRGHFAAGVEACASCGGQLTPPIMGSAAFIMMEFIGISYVDVMKVSIIPALLYFIACFGMVDLEARRAGLKPALQADLPRVWDVLKRRGYLLLSIFALLYYLFEGYTPSTAAFWSIIYLACLVVLFDDDARRRWIFALLPVAWLAWYMVPGFDFTPALSGALVTGAAINFAIDSGVRRRFLRIVWNAAVEAPKLIAPVTVACAVGGMIIGVISLTGLGERMSTIVLEFGGGYLFLTLFLTMVMAVFLGMGMPTSGAYVVLATLLVPALETMLVPHYGSTFGLPADEASKIAVVAAHMFIIFCASKSSLTPPVAIASYAAAAVANTDPWKTSLTAFRIGLPIFIIPYMFIYGPQLLGYLGPVEIALASLTATAGVLILSVSCIGWLLIPLHMVERGVACIAALFLMFSGWRTDLIGFGLFGLLLAFAYVRYRRARARGDTPRFIGGDMVADDTGAAALPSDPPGD